MLIKEVSRALEELAAIIARLQFVAAELQRAKQLETKRQRKGRPSKSTSASSRKCASRVTRRRCSRKFAGSRVAKEISRRLCDFGAICNCSPLALAGSLGSEHRAAGKAGADGGESA